MGTRIRLRRMGRKKHPTYRIIVADRAAPRDGKFIESIGHYEPQANPVVIKVDREKALHWIAAGALPSDTVKSLLRKAGIFKPAAEEPAAVEAAPAVEEDAAEEDAATTDAAAEE